MGRELLSGIQYLIFNINVQFDFCGTDGHCVAVCEAIGRSRNYRFQLQKSKSHLLPENIRGFSPYFQNCNYREYRCSQRQITVPPVKISDPDKRRRRHSMKRFPCLGSLKFVFLSSDEERAGKSLHSDCSLLPSELLVEYRHDVKHEGRQNFLMPAQIKE